MFDWESGLKKLIEYWEQLCGDILLLSPNDESITEFDDRQILTSNIIAKGLDIHLPFLRLHSDKYSLVFEVELYRQVRKDVAIVAVVLVGITNIKDDEVVCAHWFNEIAALLQGVANSSDTLN